MELTSSSGDEFFKLIRVEANQQLVTDAHHRRAVIARRPFEVVERGFRGGQLAHFLALGDDHLLDLVDQGLGVLVIQRLLAAIAFLGDF